MAKLGQAVACRRADRRSPRGAIHHLAYDRNVMGIDPTGVVHIATRLLHEIDRPMLRVGL